MKIERNDPCHCGSGKKYKKCCLAKDEAAARQAARVAPEAVDPFVAGDTVSRLPMPGDRPPPEPRLLSPQEAAREELWNEFEAADIAEVPALFRRALDGQLLDDEFAFELLSRLHDKRELAQFDTLLEELRAAQPDLYRSSAHYYLEMQIADAIATSRLERLPELAAALAETTGNDLDLFYRSRDRLAYHGLLQLLADTMARAWPHVRASNKFIFGADQEFAADAQQFTLLAYLEHTAAPRADDPSLLAALEQFAAVDQQVLADHLALFTGEEDRPWDRTDMPDDERLNRLGFRFQGELARRWGVHLGRGELGRVALITYTGERGATRTQKSRDKRRSGGPAAPGLLCPDRESLDHYIAQRLDILSYHPIEAAVTLELTPYWLRFLQGQDLITAEQCAEALRSLGKLVQDAEPIWADHQSDPSLGPNIRAAWERAADG